MARSRKTIFLRLGRSLAHGGTLDEVMHQEHLSPAHILAGIERFVVDRAERRWRISALTHAAQRIGGQSPFARAKGSLEDTDLLEEMGLS